MSDPQKNAALWDSVCVTDAKYTKQFSRGGGFKGTATNATWLARQATRAFGPCGIGWGFNVIDERYADGKPGDVIHIVRVKLWYVLDGQRGEIEQFGQTTFVGTNSKGAFTDEEAPKKSITDAVSKCLSLLGFASDIHLGLWDDNKYADDRANEAGSSDGGIGEKLSKPGYAYGPEEAERAEKQGIVAEVLANGFVSDFSTLTHVDDAMQWLDANMKSVDALGEKMRKHVAAECSLHVARGVVEGMSTIGFREAWKAARDASRGGPRGGSNGAR